MSISLDLQKISDHPDVPSFPQFEQWLGAALDGHRENAEISIRIVDEEESQSLNHQYRGKDKPTNVLSFPFEIPEGIPPSEMNHLLGDLVVCAPVVKREAEQQGKLIHHHWAHMVIHGVLHLLGFDHINDTEAEQMEQMERDMLSKLEISDPYKG